MNLEQLEPNAIETKLAESTNTIRGLAKQHTGNSLALLSILRSLEGLHQEIREHLFQEALPENRQALYSLLRDIEASGGWPYIHRMRLQALLTKLVLEEDEAVERLQVERSPTTKPD